ncbi:MAG TPA: biotin--[acetyl-CoA-carboxylase] ligase [Acidimicrobiales bacterium]
MPTSPFTIHRFEEVDSTNDWLAAAARDGAPDKTVAVADFQLRGRGRLEREWQAPPRSGLLCSVLLRVALDAPLRHLATVAVALGALEACRDAASLEVGLKWPNDLVVSDRKLGGILAETDGAEAQDGSVAVVVGLGVNLTWSGPTGVGATCIQDETGTTVGRDELLDAYLARLSPRAEQLGASEGRARLLGDYRAALVTIGRDVRVELSGDAFTGVATALTDEGHLVVRTDAGSRVVTAGDVVHVRAAGTGHAGPHE